MNLHRFCLVSKGKSVDLVNIVKYVHVLFWSICMKYIKTVQNNNEEGRSDTASNEKSICCICSVMFLKFKLCTIC